MPLSFFPTTSPRLRPLFASTLLLCILGCAGGTTSSSGGGGGSTTPSVPVLTAISPSTATIGTSSLLVTATGSNFTNGSSIQFAGSSVSTTYVSSTSLTATLSSTQLSAAGTYPIAVLAGSQISSSLSFTVTGAPATITSLSPTTVTVGASSAIITITGTGFVSGATASVNGVVRPTTFISATSLTVTLPSTDLAALGTLPITVTNPNASPTAAVNLSVIANNGSFPTILSVAPNSVVVGSPATTIAYSVNAYNTSCFPTVNGTKIAGSASYYLSSPYLIYFSLPSSSFASTGTLSMSLICNNSVFTNVLPLTVVNPPVPTLTSVSSSVAINTATAITVTGTGFTPATTLTLNGVSLPATYVSSTSLSVTIPAGALSLSGGTLQASTPAPGGGTSNTIPVSAYLNITSNSMIYNPGTGLFYLSVPSSAGLPYGNSIVSVDPATGAIGTPIRVGSEPNHMALSADNSTLWVGLDGSGSVAKVLLSSATVSYTFPLATYTSGVLTMQSQATASALASVPVTGNDSVAVASTNTNSYSSLVQVYDHGTPRTNSVSSYSTSPTALQIDGTRSELYAASSGLYATYTYSSTGVVAKASTSASSYASAYNDDLQLLAGRVYTDVGKVVDAESGSLLGSLYLTGTTLATGPTVADNTLNKIFVLDNSSYSYSTPNQIQIFDLNTYTTSANTIQLGTLAGTSTYSNTAPSHLTRWGSNGLAFRTGGAFYSVRSNFVNDLSSTNADLSVTASAPASTATGANTVYTLTVSNAGPSAATAVALNVAAPSTGAITAITTTQGTCSAPACSLGTLASGSSATVSITVGQLTAGTGTLTATVNGSENDPSTANNTASASTTVSGNTYAPVPAITSLSPNAIQTALTTDTTVTVNGTNFTSASKVMLGSTALSTTYVSTTQVKATVPAANSASLGWAPVTVTTAAPGGGTSNALPLSYFQVITAGINHILYDPFSRKIMASIGSGSSTLTGNSLAALTPETGAFATPVNIGSQPSAMALSQDGTELYTTLTGSQSIARFNMLTQSLDYAFTPTTTGYYSPSLGQLSVQPGSSNTIAVDLGQYVGVALYDFNPATKTAAIRGTISGIYTSSNPQFADSATLYGTSTLSTGSINRYTVTGTGLGTPTSYTLKNFNAFTINSGLAFANAGGLASLTGSAPTQLGSFPVNTSGYSYYSYYSTVAPDPANQRAFFLAATNNTTNYYGYPDGILGFDTTTFLPTLNLPMNIPTIEGNSSVTGVDFIRWGQDGLAALTSGGHLYLVRGGAVLASELTTNPAATLTSLSSTTATHGASNTTLTINGSSFVRGAAFLWNGNYRTTTWLSATQLSVAIPAADLATTGTATVTVSNPNSNASNSLTFTIQ